MRKFFKQEESYNPNDYQQVVHHFFRIMTVIAVRVMMLMRVLVAVIMVHVRQGVEKHIAKEAPNSERNQVLGHTFSSFFGAHEHAIQAKDHKNWNH